MLVRETTIDLGIGTPVRFLGDVANLPGSGRIVEFKSSEWGTQVRVTLDEIPSQFGAEFSVPARDFWVSVNCLRDENRWTIGG